MDEDKLRTMILAAAFRIHSQLGPACWNLRLGYVLNFGEVQLKTGIKRLING
jgi:hypothetical protein